MYKPNFCCDCGERIRRLRWSPWTSRRFCPKCATRLRQATRIVPLAGVVALVASAWIVGRESSPAPPPLVIERGAFASSSSQPLAGANAESDKDAGTSASGGDATPARATAAARLATAAPLEDPNEIVSICGARTKKGTPCSRRVRGTGRCYQHKGKPAMLPPGKLVIN